MIALTGAATPLGQEFLAALDAEHEVVGLDADPPGRGRHRPPADDTIEGWQAALEGVDALVHATLLQPAESRGLSAEHAWLDRGGRQMHALLTAAHQAGVKRFILVSSLEMMVDYDDDLIVHGTFPPRPSTEPQQLAWQIAESACREAAREFEMSMIVFRVGRMVREEEVAGQPFDPLWVDVRDAGGLLALIAPREGRRWFRLRHLHACAPRPDALTPFVRWGRHMEWEPQHRFESCPARVEVTA